MSTDPKPFDPTGPLPTGVTVLEASAGTGKTFTISGLTARHVARGTALSSILLITFTNAAATELRARVRGKLVELERDLSLQLAGAPVKSPDDVTALLAAGSADEVELRRDYLRSAVADFDAATIATTHGFCQDMLFELGTVGDLEPGTQFVANSDELLGQVVDDLYIRAFSKGIDAPFSRPEAGLIAGIATRNPGVPVEPSGEPKDSGPDLRRRLAVGVRGEFDTRRRQMALMTYNDQLTRLWDVLRGRNGEAAAARLCERFEVVLVDEFQDTDPIQWEILESGFANKGATVVLIADPKQAIYAFRGADVYAYVQAQQSAGTTRTLDVNWRSDQGLIDAYDQLFAEARLGHEEIVYRRVRAPAANQTPRLTGAPVGEPLRIRLVARDEDSVWCGAKGFVDKRAAESHVARDLADDVVRLLDSGAELETRADDGTPLKRETVRPRHVAVLVRTHNQAAIIQESLMTARVPAVIGGSGSVFATEAATHWLRLLEALERPASPSRAGNAALTPFIGWDATRLACADEHELAEVHQLLHQWARVLRSRGVAALLRTITIGEGLAARVLSIRTGERLLTDIRHVAELVHQAAMVERLGISGLDSWLRHRIVDAVLEDESDERARRLESDAEAVQVITIHASKGLEFPIVYCPFLWDPTWIRDDEPVVFHDPAAGNRRTIDVGLEGPGFKADVQQFQVEQRGEDLRLAYVALTRAMHQAVVWWVPTYHSHDSPLARLVFSKQADGTIPASGAVKPTDAQAWERFQGLAGGAPGRISVERSTLEKVPSAWTGLARPTRELSVALFDRTLDLRWRRASYSSITATAHDAWVASEPEESVELDEPDAPTPAPADDDAPPEFQRLSTWRTLPVGTEFGTITHRVLEATDFATPDLESQLTASTESIIRGPTSELDRAVFVSGVREAIETPLGSILSERRLRDFALGDRLDELEFELPLVGGDNPSGRLTVRSLADVVRSHLDPADPLYRYAERLADPTLQAVVRGYLTGSIDLVLRVRENDRWRFAIVDYKTNWLGPPDVDLSLWHYRPSALRAEMLRAHYGLQALLYTAALHRYLRWRVPEYDPDVHLMGVLYLFLRGMAGPDTPTIEGQRCGVFAWRPPAGLVEALSGVLDEGAGS